MPGVRTEQSWGVSYELCFLLISIHLTSFISAQMRFPNINKMPHHGTLLDGEMVVDWDTSAKVA